MIRFVPRLFTPTSAAALRSYTCLICRRTSHGRSSDVQNCEESSTPIDVSKLTNSPLDDDFDLNDEDSSSIDFTVIAQGDPVKLENLKLIQQEINAVKIRNNKMPSKLSAKNWTELLKFNTPSRRKKYLNFLWEKELRNNVRKITKQEKQKMYAKYQESLSQNAREILTTSSPVEYKLTSVALFKMIPDTFINRFLDYKLLQNEWFGPHIILDCGYDVCMNRRTISRCANQILRLWTGNRSCFNPYDIFLCNLDTKGPLWEQLIVLNPKFATPDSPIHYTDQHYSNFFPKEKLVYLTPDCSEVLKKYNPNDIYIIGAYLDDGSSEPLSLVRAKKEGLRKAKFPLETYLRWQNGSKSLPLTNVLAIMNDLKNGLPWPEALKNVPPNRAIHEGFKSKDIYEEHPEPHTGKSVRESYQKNMVYDILMKKRFKQPPEEK